MTKAYECVQGEGGSNLVSRYTHFDCIFSIFENVLDKKEN